MSELANFTQALFGAANTASNVVDKYTTSQAELSTSFKQGRLQDEIITELENIKRSSKYENWQTDMNNFFERVKGEMSDENSQYYCKNNLQAEMFGKILEQQRIGVREKVNQMVFTAERDHALVDYNNLLGLYAKQYTGQDYINKCNEAAKLLFDSGYIDESQLQTQYDTNFERAYIDTNQKLYNNNIADAVKNNMSEDQFIEDMKTKTTELMAIDTAGLPKSFDKQAMDETLEKYGRQNYKAYVSDLQQRNANKLSEIVQAMWQQTTAEGQVAQARYGQNTMNNMLGLQLNESDRVTYAKYFQLALGGDSLKGSGGSGSGTPKEAFSDLLKYKADTVLQLAIDGKLPNVYASVEAFSQELEWQWMNADFKENYEKTASERADDFTLIYRGQASESALTDVVINKFIEKYPSVGDMLKNNYKNLTDDIKKNPDKYGGASTQELAEWLIDTLMGSNGQLTNAQVKELFDKHVNDCYVEKCQYVELNKHNKLEAKFNPMKESDIAQAAKITQEKDYLYTYKGEDKWAPKKKEALEAEGGVVNVLQSAVRSTLDIPENEGIDFIYKSDQKHDDKTSTPIFTYKNKAYEVVPNADESGFNLIEYSSKKGSDGLPVIDWDSGKEIKGKVKDYAGERAAEKKQLKINQKTAHDERTAMEDKRIAETDEKMKTVTEQPKAIIKVWGKDSEEWKKTQNTIDARQRLFHDTEVDINNAAKKVQSNKMLPEQFKAEYGIDYYAWKNTKNSYEHYNLILNSK